MTKEEAIKYLEESILIYKNTIPKISRSIETVLSMIKEKDKEIEKKDKIIDLMAEEIKERKYVFTNKTKKDIKQYFERKSEE